MSRIAPGTLIVMIFALVFGLVGAYAVQRKLAMKPAAPRQEAPQKIRIPLASTDLEPGRAVTLGDVAMVSGTVKQLREQYNLPAEYMTSASQIIGRTLRQSRSKGETFSPDNFYPEGTGPSIAERLKPGFRAVTIPVQGAAALNGFASPHSYVDVMFRSEKTEHFPEMTITLVEAAEVLALDRESQNGAQDGEAATVTLAVTADQANAFRIAESRGVFSLALRNPEDESQAISYQAPQTLNQLLNRPEPEQPFRAEVYRGSAKTTMEFPRSERRRDEVRINTTPAPALGDSAQRNPAGSPPAFAVGSP